MAEAREEGVEGVTCKKVPPLWKKVVDGEVREYYGHLKIVDKQDENYIIQYLLTKSMGENKPIIKDMSFYDRDLERDIIMFIEDKRAEREAELKQARVNRDIDYWLRLLNRFKEKNIEGEM